MSPPKDVRKRDARFLVILIREGQWLSHFHLNAYDMGLKSLGANPE